MVRSISFALLACVCSVALTPVRVGAQSLCASMLAESGGTVRTGSGAELRTRLAPALSGKVVSARGAALRGGLSPAACSGSIPTSVEQDTPRSPASTRLAVVAPNPFNPRTAVHFDLACGGLVRLDVFDAAGRHVRRIVDAELPAGSHERVLDGDGLASGVYHLRLRADGSSSAQSVVLVK